MIAAMMKLLTLTQATPIAYILSFSTANHLLLLLLWLQMYTMAAITANRKICLGNAARRGMTTMSNVSHPITMYFTTFIAFSIFFSSLYGNEKPRPYGESSVIAESERSSPQAGSAIIFIAKIYAVSQMVRLECLERNLKTSACVNDISLHKKYNTYWGCHQCNLCCYYQNFML